MTFKEFKEILKEELLNILPEGTNITLVTIPKNNGVKKEALTIHDNSEPCTPVIYLEEYYFNFNNGRNIKDIAEEILLIYKNNRVTTKINIRYLHDYSFVKSRVFIKIINKKQNLELLENVVYKDFLDLAIVFCCDTTDIMHEKSSFIIRNDFMSVWDISPDILYEDAYINTKNRRPFVKHKLNDLINKMKPCECGLPCNVNFESDINAFVFTNEECLYGASFMVYTDLLQEFCEEIDSDVVVIPSSVNEVILIPENNINVLEGYSNIVNEVSQMELDISDVLSYHAYYFSRNYGYIIKTN